MRILMVTEFFSPVLGGIPSHIADLSKALTKRGHRIIILALGWNGLSQHEIIDGIEVVRITGLFQRLDFIYSNKNYRFHPPISDPIFSKEAYRFIKSFQPDVIHCHGWIIYSLLSIKKKLVNIPLVFTLHDYGLMCPARTMFNSNNVCSEALTPECLTCAENKVGTYKARVMCWALNHNRNNLKMIDKYIAVSTSVKDIHSQYLESDKIEVICNFYNSSIGPKTEEAISLPDDFIMFAGALKPEKGVNVLVDAYRKLNTSTKLVIIGMKRPGFNLQASPGIILLENQPRDVVMEAWQKCLFAVIPSVWAEPGGIIALEAMSCKKAIIGSNIGGLKDSIINNETGILVPPGNADALSSAIQDLLDNPVLAADMGQKGYMHLHKQFSVNKIVGDTEKLYKSLI